MTVRRFARRIAVCSCVMLAAAPQTVQAQGAALSPELQSVRNLLDKYADPIVAVHDGFYSSVGCISYPNGGGEGAMRYPVGAMGVHFINMGNVGPTLDPAKPQVLIYEPVGDKLRLVAAEWFMPADLAGGKAPTIFGQELGGPMEGHKPIMPDGLHHYDLHVWLWKTNPEGVFTPTNPAVKCPTTGYSFAEAAPKMAHPHK
jgi:hypothetical protein